MSLNLSALKKSSSKDLLNKLASKLGESTKKTFEKDTRFWNATVDASGNGTAIVRFLPAKTENSFPFVKVYSHVFQENGMWMFAECPTTIGEQCPVCDANRELWNSGVEANKTIVRRRKRGLKYIANVLVIKDPAHPENEGQVKLMKFGSKIFEKIEECLTADPDMGEERRDPFSFFDGANFNMKVQTIGGYINYDKCRFVPASDLYDGEEAQLREVLSSMHDLNEFTDRSVFKSYAELKARFEKVTGTTSDDEEAEVSSSASERFESPSSQKSSPVKATPKATETDDSGDDDDDLEFFKRLAGN